MEIKAQNLHFGERVTLRQLMKAKAGDVTVREAREHCAPTGWAFIVQIVGVTLLSLGLGFVFLPFLLVAIAAPVVMILRQRGIRRRWLKILPPERDSEPLTLI